MNDDRVRDIDQPGWNQGYIAGEAERLALAVANVDLRSELRDAQCLIAKLLRRLEEAAA